MARKKRARIRISTVFDMTAVRIRWRWTIESTVEKPAKQRNEQDERPEQLPKGRVATVRDPELSDKTETNKDADGENDDAKRPVCGKEVENRHVTPSPLGFSRYRTFLLRDKGSAGSRFELCPY